MSARLSTLFRLAEALWFRVRTRRLRAELDQHLADRRAGRAKRQAAAQRGVETKFQRRMEGLTR